MLTDKPPKAADPLLHELLNKRWSPRAFSPQPIPDDYILSLFEAARWSASSANEQPWRFIYATKQQPERYQKLFDCLNPGNQIWAGSAPLLVATLVQTTFTRNQKPNKYAYHDLGLAIGSLTVQALSLDIYVHNMGGFSADKVRQTFPLPENVEPATMIAIGYLGAADQLPPDLQERERAPQLRKPLSELII